VTTTLNACGAGDSKSRDTQRRFAAEGTNDAYECVRQGLGKAT